MPNLTRLRQTACCIFFADESSYKQVNILKGEIRNWNKKTLCDFHNTMYFIVYYRRKYIFNKFFYVVTEYSYLKKIKGEIN